MNTTQKNVIVILLTAMATAFLPGCGGIGAITGNVSSEAPSEKVTKAEFNLAATDGKVLVFVNQPGWIKTPMDLRVSLTNALNLSLEEKAGLKKERLIPYADVLKLRMAMPNDKKDDPLEIGPRLNAQYILAVQVMAFDLSTFAEKDFFNGQMITKACLYDRKGTKLWPAGEGYKEVKVAFDVEKGTIESAVERLSAATSYCITRYFYNCKTNHFRIAEEQKELDSDKW